LASGIVIPFGLFLEKNKILKKLYELLNYNELLNYMVCNAYELQFFSL